MTLQRGVFNSIPTPVLTGSGSAGCAEICVSDSQPKWHPVESSLIHSLSACSVILGLNAKLCKPAAIEGLSFKQLLVSKQAVVNSFLFRQYFRREPSSSVLKRL